MTILQEKPSEEVFTEPQYPWKKVNPSTSITNSIIVVLPISIFALGFFLTDLPGTLLFIVVFLPVQILVAIFATIWGISKKRVGDAVLSVLSLVAFSFVIALMGSVLFSVFSRGLPAISLSFLTQNNTYISPTTELDYGGVGHALLGTLMVVAIGMVISIPLGIASAIYITDMKGRLAGFVRFMVQAMSGVPSIVAGLFILAAFILTDVSGFSALTGGLAYSILMLPTVARTSEEVLKLVPKDLRDAAIALGSSRARVIMKIVLPTARTGILTAVILGVARVIGETAPLLLTTSNTNGTNLNPFVDAVSTIPVYIFQFLGSGYPTAINRSWGAAFVLLTTVAILFAIARIVERSTKKG